MPKSKLFCLFLFWKKRFSAYTYCFGLVIVFLLLRFFFVFYSPYSIMPEESKQGILGIDLIEGIYLPIECYMEAPHAGGKLTDGLLVIPFFLILGFNLFALKLLAIIFSVATVYVWCRCFNEFYGRSYLLIFLVLICFAPPHFIQQNTASFGNLVEPMFFISTSIYFFYKIALNQIQLKRNYFLLGLISGFGIWIQYGQAPVFVVIFLYLMLYVKNVNLKSIGVLLGGFFVGILPLLLYRSYVSLSYDYYVLGMDHNFFLIDPIFLEDFVDLSCFIVDSLIKVPFLLFVNIPFSFHFSDFIVDEYWYAHAYLLFCFISLVGLVSGIVLSLFQKIKKKKSIFVRLDTSYFIKQSTVPIIFLVLLLVFCLKSGNMISSGNLVYSGNFTKALFYDKAPDYQLGKMDHRYGHYEVFFHLFLIVLLTVFLGNLVINKSRYLHIIAYGTIAMLVLISVAGYRGLFPKKLTNNCAMLFHYQIKKNEGTDIIINEYVSFGYRYKFFLYDMSRVYSYPLLFQKYFLKRIAQYLSLEISTQDIRCFDLNKKTFPSILNKSVSSDNLIYWLREKKLSYEYLSGKLNSLSIMDRRYFIMMIKEYLKEANVSPIIIERVIHILTLNQ